MPLGPTHDWGWLSSHDSIALDLIPNTSQRYVPTHASCKKRYKQLVVLSYVRTWSYLFGTLTLDIILIAGRPRRHLGISDSWRKDVGQLRTWMLLQLFRITHTRHVGFAGTQRSIGGREDQVMSGCVGGRETSSRHSSWRSRFV